MQIELRRALDEEAHFVVGMSVLGQELGAQRLGVRGGGRDADHVHGLVAAVGLQPVDVAGVGGEHGRIVGVRRQLGLGGPALEDDADLGKSGGDFGRIARGQARRARGVVGKDSEAAHARPSRPHICSSSMAISVSAASTTLIASAMLVPQPYRP